MSSTHYISGYDRGILSSLGSSRTHIAALLLYCLGAFFSSLAVALPAATTVTTLQVGPDRVLKKPSDAARVARSGDTVEIDAGVYHNDFAVWEQEDLTLRAVGGMAHLSSEGQIPNGKAIWVVSGNNTTIENIEFSGAAVADTNGAGIRHEGGNLTLRNTYFHHNEFSILTGKDTSASLEIHDSRFWFQKRAGRFSHGMYVGELKRFTLTGSHVKGTHRGHQIKTRALENHILYNRIEDVPQGTSSRLIDFSNCGLSYVIGNDMHQTQTTQNVDAIGYGAEGCEGRSPQQLQLYVINNTFVNEAWNGALVRNHAQGDLLLANNLIFGQGKFLLGKGRKQNNLTLNLMHRVPGSWAVPMQSAAVDSAVILPPANGVALLPDRVFKAPSGSTERTVHGSMDIGSQERAP